MAEQLKGKKVFIFGAGNYGRQFCRLFFNTKFRTYFPDFEIVGFIDNNEKKQKHYICGFKVYSLERVKEMIFGHLEEYAIILSSPVMAPGMIEQLYLQFSEKIYCYLIPEWVLKLNITEEMEPYVLVPIDITKPVLSRIEFKVVHHCNLNCKGCNVLCGLREEKCADWNEFKQSLIRLKDFFSNITTIKLLGGEPLLHPELHKFIEAIRMVFPAANMEIHTNGLLIPTVENRVFEAARKYECSFIISSYPVTRVMLKKIEDRLEKENMSYSVLGDMTVFKKRINPMGTCDRRANEKNCPQWYALYEGKLSRCFLWDSLRYLKNRFPEFKIDEEKLHDYIDLYNTRLNGREIIQKLKKPTEYCIYCGMVDDDPELYEWSRASEKDLNTIDSWLMSKK